MRDFDLRVTGCLYVMWCFLGALVTVPLLIFGAVSEKPEEATLALGVAAAAFVSGLFLVLLVHALRRRKLRHPMALERLEALRARFGGELVLATLAMPTIQPRLRAQVDGRPLEVRLYPVQGSVGAWLAAKGLAGANAQLGTRAFGRVFRVNVDLGAAAPSAFSAGTRTRVSPLAAGLTKLRSASLGDAAWDERFTLSGEHPEQLSAALRHDPQFAQAITALLSVNAPYFAGLYVGRASKLNYGATWTSVMTERLDGATLVQVVEELRNVAIRAGG